MAKRDDDQMEVTSQIEVGQESTFADAKGSEANQHAKKTAKAKSKKQDALTSEAYYSQKGDKLLKHIAKPGKVFTVYVGNMKKHGDALAVFVGNVKKDGKWLKAEDVQDTMGALQEKLTEQAEAGKKRKA